jgi:hypothetical protein
MTTLKFPPSPHPTRSFAHRARRAHPPTNTATTAQLRPGKVSNWSAGVHREHVSDIVGRIVAEQLQAGPGVAVDMENKSGRRLPHLG